jgi:hypothetical protein
MIGERGPEWVVPYGKGGAGAPAVSAPAPVVHTVRLEFAGNANDALWQLIRKNIRVRGGNVAVVGA